MSLFQPLNEGKRVSYKKYMRNGALFGVGHNFAKNAIYNHKYGINNPYNPHYGISSDELALGGIVGGAGLGATLAFARNHSKKIDNILRGRSPFRRGIEIDRAAAAAKANANRNNDEDD